ncbi:MAG: DUF2312 domain-containing protein [Rhizobiaceae bacterium]|nr:DUF2312 domain-containing protein [Rhizobiaceae bacterium]
MSASRLKSYIERIEKLIEERVGIQSDIKDVFSEAKGVGYDTKTMRKVIALRALDAAERDEQQALLDTYWHELEQIDRVQARVAAGEPVKRATEAEGYSRATYYRVSQRASKAPNETHCGESALKSGEPALTRPEVGRKAPLPTNTASEVAVPPGDGEAPASNDAAGAPSPSIEESCGGEVKALATSPAQGPVVSEPDETRPAVAGFASGTSHEQGNRPLGVAPEPQDTDLTSDDDAITEMLAAKDRLDALKREKGLAA